MASEYVTESKHKIARLEFKKITKQILVEEGKGMQEENEMTAMKALLFDGGRELNR